MQALLVICLVVAYLAANVYAIVELGVFESACSRKRLILYGVPCTRGALSSCWDASSGKSCADSMNAPPNGLLN